MHPSALDDDDLAISGVNPEEEGSSFWINNAQRHLKGVLNSKPYETPKKAKNIILFLGDGMSLTTVAAARVFIGGEEKSLSFEKFPYFGLSKVMHLVQLLRSVCPHPTRYHFYVHLLGIYFSLFCVFSSNSDVLCEQTSCRFGVHVDRLPERREGELRDDGDQRGRRARRLQRAKRQIRADRVDCVVGAEGMQGDGPGHHQPRDARVARRPLRA